MTNHPVHRNRRYRHLCAAGAFALLPLAFSFAGGAFGAGISAIEAYAMTALTLDKGGEGRKYEVVPGDTVIIRLPENPTTGYQWEVEFFDSSVLGPPGSSFSKVGEPSVGAGGMRTFTFQARAPGITSLRMILKRGWERHAVDHFEITLQVLEMRR